MAECVSYIWQVIKILVMAILGVAVLLYTFIKWVLIGLPEEDNIEEYMEEDEAI